MPAEVALAKEGLGMPASVIFCPRRHSQDADSQGFG
jgi:hypothetical protein